MTTVELDCITMAGNQYALFPREGAPVFPRGELRDGEAPADAARRVVKDWSGTDAPPKLEIVDLRAAPGKLALVFRAHLTADPVGAKLVPRMGLPERVGPYTGKDVEEMLKTSLAYKLTRT
jgi:predicted NUDIX family NTP pyrophosphohydrolase